MAYQAHLCVFHGIALIHRAPSKETVSKQVNPTISHAPSTRLPMALLADPGFSYAILPKLCWEIGISDVP